jgi:hypothetical protein
MRNMRRLQKEVSALKNRYGRVNVVAPSNYEWVKLVEFPLLPGMFNLSSCTVLIKIPSDYDLVNIRECYVDRDLLLRVSSQSFEDLPHVHSGHGYDEEGYQWLCFEEPQGDNGGLIGFINTLRAYFTDPHGYVKTNEG